MEVIRTSVQLHSPIVLVFQIFFSNLLRVHVDSAFSVPDAWQAGQQFIYTISLPVPLSAQVCTVKFLRFLKLKENRDGA